MAMIGRNNVIGMRREVPAGAAAAIGTPVDRFLINAMRFLGQPYKWGGGHGATMSRPGPVDCSGLVQQAARMAGIPLGGRARDLQAKLKGVPMSEIKAGDLVFKGHPATHVGIYIGDGKVLHAPKTGDVVRTTTVDGFQSAGRPAAFEGTRARPVDVIAPVRPARPPMPATPPKAVGPGEPSVLPLPIDPDAPLDAIPAYRERFGRKSYVKDGADRHLLALARAAVARAPELARTNLGLALGEGVLGPDDIKTLQQFLEGKGFSVGVTGVDGKYGPRTHRALAAFLEAAPKAA